ncbi:MAG: hypothetical protein ACREER_06770 [Alphaproteobacteria bacterium]
MRNQPYVPKSKLLVELELSSGTTLRGWVFIAAESRELEAFNSGPTFLPFLDEKNQIRFINKAHVVQVTPLEGRNV